MLTGQDGAQITRKMLDILLVLWAKWPAKVTHRRRWLLGASPGSLPGGWGNPIPPGKYWRPASAAAGFDIHPYRGVGRFVDKTFRRRISGRFVDSIINVIPPLRDSSSYYSFHSLGLKYFQFVFRLVTRHLAAYVHVGRGRSPGRADRVSAGPVVSNSEPLSPGRTMGLACSGAAQWYRSVKVAKYHKYSSETQINVVKVSLPHTLFWLLTRFVKLKPCIRPVNAPVYETSQLVYETSDTKRLVGNKSCRPLPMSARHVGPSATPPVMPAPSSSLCC